MRKLLLVPLLVVGVLALPARAQTAGITNTKISSEPGKVQMQQTTEMTARVVGIDRTARVVTLKGREGNTVDIVCGDDVRNFDQIKLGDQVSARYVESLYLELKNTKAGVRESVETEGGARAQLGERPAGLAVRELVVLADVVGVDPEKKTITLKGPKGNLLTLPVTNPAQFKVVKEGDQVEATYTQAFAVSVDPTPVLKK
jgi:Cu/Ag efflux protein CusF